MKKINKYIPVAVVTFILLSAVQGFSQQKLSLQEAMDATMQNHRGLQIKKLQHAEKSEKINEDKIKKMPSAIVNSTYQYNANIGLLTIEQGSFGALPLSQTVTIPLPSEDKSFELGKHQTFNAGATIYQPITQQAKINTGIKISENEVKINEAETRKMALQLQEAVQKIYFGILINQKKIEQETANLEVEKIKLYDVESALKAGKTINLSKEGLLASIADKEQEILKLEIENDNFRSDLKNLTNLPIENFSLDEQTQFSENTFAQNPDKELADLNLEKAKLAVVAAKQSNLPDVGLIGGYTFQTGNIIFPTHNPFIGINLKWNLQDILTNKSQEKQRYNLVKQAEQNILLQQENIANETEKATRKIEQFSKLILVAQKAVNYRKEEWKLQTDKQAAGLNTKADVLNAQANMAKAQADLFAAQLGYHLAVSDLKRINAQSDF